MKSFLSNLENLIGEFRSEEYYSIYARPSAGKTLYVLEEAVNLISQGATIIYLSTENGFEGLFEEWKPKFEEKFNVKVTEQNFKIFKIYNLENLMDFLGRSINITIGDKGKMTTFLVEEKKKNIDTLPIHISKAKNPVIILDSFSVLFREDFNTATQNFSARSDAVGFLFATLKEIMRKYNAFTIMLHHASIDPMNLYNQPDKMRGGTIISYYSKYILYFEVERKNTMRDYRKVFGVRLAGKKDWVNFAWLRIDDSGYHDATITEAEEAYSRK
jgi:KaiC/GvpD/RAD55 family RecA-like ATPase